MLLSFFPKLKFSLKVEINEGLRFGSNLKFENLPKIIQPIDDISTIIPTIN